MLPNVKSLESIVKYLLISILLGICQHLRPEYVREIDDKTSDCNTSRVNISWRLIWWVVWRRENLVMGPKLIQFAPSTNMDAENRNRCIRIACIILLTTHIYIYSYWSIYGHDRKSRQGHETYAICVKHSMDVGDMNRYIRMTYIILFTAYNHKFISHRPVYYHDCIRWPLTSWLRSYRWLTISLKYLPYFRK